MSGSDVEEARERSLDAFLQSRCASEMGSGGIRCDPVYGTVAVHDRPLTFHWRAPPDWLDGLDLTTPCSKRHARARQSILLEAVLADVGGWPAVSYSRRRAFYTDLRRYHGTAFTYSTVVPTIKDLVRQGFLETTIAPGRGPCGRQSTFHATKLLLDQVPEDLVRNAIYAVRELVVLRDADGRPRRYRDTARTDRMRHILAEANEAIDGAQIDFDFQRLNGCGMVTVHGVTLIPAMRTLYRVFNKDFRHGGRMYGPFWQQMPRISRRRLIIDGEPVVELDYAQLHPRLLYEFAGQDLARDAYTLDGWNRPLCKKAFNILLNAPSYQSALGALARELGSPDRKSRARQLIAEIKRKHRPVEGHFHSGIGLRLQRIDADMAEAVIVCLLKQGIVALPVHDSFIVQQRHAGLLKDAMDGALFRAKRLR